MILISLYIIALEGCGIFRTPLLSKSGIFYC
nr:MAG TPA: hypothetical protein [Caudoviricetes sp.]